MELTLWDKDDEIDVSSNYEPVVFSETFKQSCVIKSNFTSFENKNKLYKSKSKEKPLDKNLIKINSKKKRCESEFWTSSEFDSKTKTKDTSYKLKGNIKYNFNFTFKFKPQYVKAGQTIVIYDFKIRATGTVIECHFID